MQKKMGLRSKRGPFFTVLHCRRMRDPDGTYFFPDDTDMRKKSMPKTKKMAMEATP